MVDPHGKVHPISGKSWKEAHNIYSTFVLMCIISQINKLQKQKIVFEVVEFFRYH